MHEGSIREINRARRVRAAALALAGLIAVTGCAGRHVGPRVLAGIGGAAVGVVYSFPEAGHAAAGFTARVVGGANYFFFDWFALGGQVGVSLGHLNYDSTVPGSHTYSVLDLGGGAEFMF